MREKNVIVEQREIGQVMDVDGIKVELETINTELSNEQYHKAEGISSTGLKIIGTRTPYHLYHSKHQPHDPSKTMNQGSALHCIVLEPEKFDDQYIVRKKFTGTGARKAQKQYDEEMKAAGFNFLTELEMEKVIGMGKSVQENETCQMLLQDVIVESSIFWIDPEFDVLCKIRPDAMSESMSITLDLKTCVDASYTGFAKAITNYRYHESAAMYLDGLAKVGREDDVFVFMAIENTEPYLAACYEVTRDTITNIDWMEQGRLLYRHDLRKYAECYHNNTWPKYDKEIRKLTLPSWAQRQPII